MPRLITFQEAIQESQHYNKRHLLLGNGFSIACIPTIFSYNSLYEETNLTDNAEIKKAFEQLHTTDFELVIEALEKAARVLPAYQNGSTEIPLKMHSDAQKLKELLIETIASRHPHYPAEIEEEKFKACRKFLSYFVENNLPNKGYIFSLNYDLLLYWTLMHDIEGENIELLHNDGFNRDVAMESGVPHVSEYLTWQGKGSGQNIHYLHGALHIFDTGHQIEKYTWTDTGIRLIEQCRQALNEDKFPLFVSEGDYEKKLEKITHSPYLFSSYESFEAVVNGGRYNTSGNTCMFTYGLSFGDNDRHILNIFANGKLKHLFVGIYGSLSSSDNTEIIRKIELLKARRVDYPINISYYDSSSAEVWG